MRIHAVVRRCLVCGRVRVQFVFRMEPELKNPRITRLYLLVIVLEIDRWMEFISQFALIR